MNNLVDARRVTISISPNFHPELAFSTVYSQIGQVPLGL